MSLFKKLLIVGGFLFLLVILVSSDSLFTKGTLRIPEKNGADASVAKQEGPDVVAVAESRGFSAADTNEEFLLQKILLAGVPLSSRVLLKNNDRVTAVAWTDSPRVQATFTQLKERLRSSFSSDVKDLIDETQSEEGKAPRDVLSFHDPAILGDRAVFVRVRERLYEFHVTPGKEAEADGLVDALSE